MLYIMIKRAHQTQKELDAAEDQAGEDE